MEPMKNERPRVKGERYWYKPGGYETDHLIHALDDRELLAHMGVPRRFISHAVAMLDSDIHPDIDKWLENLPYIFRPSNENLDKHLCGTGLVFTGPGATRKTTTAAATLLRAIRQEIPNTDPTLRNWTWHGACMGRFVDWQEASELFRSANSGDEEAEDQAAEVRAAMNHTGPPLTNGDILLIDDISRERTTEFNVGELHRIIRRRADEGWPTILTTNHAQNEWADVYGEVFAAYLARTNDVVEFGE
jgi:hypothetical protein